MDRQGEANGLSHTNRCGNPPIAIDTRLAAQSNCDSHAAQAHLFGHGQQDQVRPQAKSGVLWERDNTQSLMVLNSINITSLNASGQAAVDLNGHCTFVQEHSANTAAVAGWSARAAKAQYALECGPLDPELRNTGGVKSPVCRTP